MGGNVRKKRKEKNGSSCYVRLSHPATRNRRHPSLADHFVVRFAAHADQRPACLAFPDSTHAFASMAPPALTLGIFGKDTASDSGKIILMHPCLTDAHDE